MNSKLNPLNQIKPKNIRHQRITQKINYWKNQTQNKYPNLEDQTRKSNTQTQKMKLEKKKKIKSRKQ